MKRILIGALAVLAVFSACQRRSVQPRPTIPLVESIVRDSSGLGRLVTMAGSTLLMAKHMPEQDVIIRVNYINDEF